MKILIVGGTWAEQGKESGLVNQFSKELRECNKDNFVKLYNGGVVSQLPEVLQEVIDYDTVLWWPNISNDVEKIRDVKKINPKTILATSKRNDDAKYSFPELVNRALSQKANLVIEFSRQEQFKMRLFDPLAALWYEGFDVSDCAKALYDRLNFLAGITRIPSVAVGEAVLAPETDFYSYVKECAEVFHSLIGHEEGVTRFLGNSSFRCQKGFPSFRTEDGIFVSQRNVDKRYIDKEAFVKTYMGDNGEVCYFGTVKPSVDTPVQQRLYSLFTNINFMIHAHCYVKGAPFTKTAVPCGAIEEIYEIKAATESFGGSRYAFNLIGHGCIIMGSTVEDIRKYEFYQRPMPEPMVKSRETIKIQH